MPAAGFALDALPGRGIERKLSLPNVRSPSSGLVRALSAGRSRLVGRRRARGRRGARRLRQRAVRPGRRAAPDPDRGGRAERRARGGQPPGRPVRQGLRRVVPGHDLPRAVVTGNPVRPEVLAVDRARDATARPPELDVEPGRRLVLVFGGSLGARRINQAVRRAARALGRARRPAPSATSSARATGTRSPPAARRVPRGAPLALPGRALRGRHADLAGGRRPRGLPGGGQHRAELLAVGPAGGPGAVADRHRRPPDGQRPAPRTTRARPWWCPTPSSTATASWPRSTPCWPTRPGWPRWAPPPARPRRPDAADAGRRARRGARPCLRPTACGPCAPRSTCRAPHAPRRRRRRRGHERHRHRAGGDGPHGQRAAT